MKKGFLILALFALAALLLVSCEFDDLLIENYELYTPGDAEIKGEVENLDVDWSSGEVNFVYGEGSTLSIAETCDKEIKDKYRMLWYLDGTTLRIRFSKSEVNLFGEPWNLKKELTVTLPKDFVGGHIEVLLASANLNTDELNADRIEVKSASGNVQLSVGQADKTEISVSSGKTAANIEKTRLLDLESSSGKIDVTVGCADEIELDGSSGAVNLVCNAFRKAELDTSSAPITFKTASAFEECKINSSSGAVTFLLSETVGFTAEIKTASGTFESEIPLAKSGKNYTAGDGAAKLEIETSSADIQIQKAQ